MATIINVIDSKQGPIRGCGACVRLENGEPIWLSLAQTSVLVKKSRWGLLGAQLYKEEDVYTNARRGIALCYLFPERRFPDGIKDPNLPSFLNAILHCRSAAEVCKTLNEAIRLAEQKAGCALDQIPASDFPAWAFPPSATDE
jgi:hypothetical protein